jgi:hypothetical protein
VILSAVLLAAGPRGLVAQQMPPQPGPAALSVPNPIPPPPSTLPVPPRDLYQAVPPRDLYQPAPPHDLYQQLTPPMALPTPHVAYPFGYGPFMYVGSPYMAAGSNAPAQAVTLKIPQGGLRFETSPGLAQVYIDGTYLGLVDDFGMSGRAIDLDEGSHRVELRAAGYATLSFDVNIAANRTTRYRGDLQRLSAPPPPSAPAVAAPPMPRKPTYMIPNCYAGDRPPSRALPRGCDIKLMQVSR